MKKLFIILAVLFCAVSSMAQTKYTLPYDTVIVMKPNGIGYLKGSKGSFTDTVWITTMGVADSSLRAASTAFVKRAVASGGGGGGSTNSNIGTGYRWAVAGTNNIKTFLQGYGLLLDSLTNTLSARADTTQLATILQLQHRIDSLAATIPAAGVTSVGLTMPSAFSVANSPVTSSGTLAVTGAGTTGQYIRGDGSLATFPSAVAPAGNYGAVQMNRNSLFSATDSFLYTTSTGLTLLNRLNLAGKGAGSIYMGNKRVAWEWGGNYFFANAGPVSLWADTTVDFASIFIGDGAGGLSTGGVNSIGIGVNALRNQLTGVSSNIAIGKVSLQNLTSGGSNAVTGASVQLTTGSFNAFHGSDIAVAGTSASNNASIGYQSLRSLSTGLSNTAAGGNAGQSNSTGSNNTDIGEYAFATNSTGSGNIGLGHFAGAYGGSVSNRLVIQSGNFGTTSTATIMGDLSNKRVGIQLREDTTLQAALTVPRGFTTQPPFRFVTTNSVLTTSPLPGAMETFNDSLYWVDNSGNRNKIWPVSGSVSSVSGTTNRITSTGGSTPVIDISASYVGQSSITTLGTISSGTWQGTAIASTYGGTPTGGSSGQALTKNSGTNYDYSWATPFSITYPNTTNRYLNGYGNFVALNMDSIANGTTNMYEVSQSSAPTATAGRLWNNTSFVFPPNSNSAFIWNPGLYYGNGSRFIPVTNEGSGPYNAKWQGDSWTANIGLSSANNGFVNKTSNYKGWTPTNSGINGSNMSDVLFLDNASDINFLECGINDMRSLGYAALSNYAAMVRNWAVYKSGTVTIGTSGTKTTPGDWIADSIQFNYTTSTRTTVNNSPISFTVSGNVIYVSIAYMNASDVYYSVTIDGVLQGNFSAALSGYTVSGTNPNKNAVFYCQRFPVSMDTMHNVVLQKTGGTGQFRVIYVGSNNTPKTGFGSNGNRSFVSTVGRMARGNSSTGYTFYGGSDTLVNSYNRVLNSTIYQLATDGLNVDLVDINKYYNPRISGYVQSDSLHPADPGATAIAKAFIERSSTIILPKERGQLNFYGSFITTDSATNTQLVSSGELSLYAKANNSQTAVQVAKATPETFSVIKSLTLPYVATATSLTADINQHTIDVTATGQTITLPTAVGISGKVYTIKLTASGSCTVATTSSQNIDGSTTYSLASQYKYVTVQSTGSAWVVIANN